MAVFSASVDALIEQFAKLPGIGKKTAERLAYHVLRIHETEALALADAIRSVKENVRYCERCFHLAEESLCEICRDPKRDVSILCVVEQPRDLLAIEAAGVFRGVYHVLLGRIAPLEGIGPDDLTIDALMQRVRSGDVQEVVMATNPTLEGDGTALHLSNLLAETSVTVTRLARGITTGSVIEFANKENLAEALTRRQSF